MILSSSARHALVDSMINQNSVTNGEFMINFWSGPLPTLAELTTKFETVFNTYDSNPGRISVGSFYTWLRDEHGAIELCGDDYGWTTGRIERLNVGEAIYTPTIPMPPDKHPMRVVAEGNADFFTAVQYNNSASFENKYSDSGYSIYHLIMGTLGLPGSGADQEIADTNITFDSTVQPGTIVIRY